MDISSIYLLYKRCIYLHMIIYWMDLDGNVIRSPSCPKLLLCGSWWFQSLVSITRLGLMICHFSSYFSSTTHVAKSIKIPIVLKILDEITIFIVSSYVCFISRLFLCCFAAIFRAPGNRDWGFGSRNDFDPQTHAKAQWLGTELVNWNLGPYVSIVGIICRNRYIQRLL